MFRSAVFKLTAWYVGALMIVCLMFSIPIYQVASARLRLGAEQQTNILRRLPKRYDAESFVPMLEQQREQQLDDDRRQLLSSLALINLLIISVGAGASYWFAKRTLLPIEELHTAQARFTSDASHELRTPLAVMQTEIEVALRQNNLTIQNAKEILSSNLEEVARLRQLSDQLLGLARAGDKPIKQSRVDVSALIKNEISKLGKRHVISIKCNVPKNIYVWADATLMRQVLDIIVENAVIYNSSDKPTIVVDTSLSSHTVKISISDNGTGIDPKDLPHIFDRFYRGKNASSKNGQGHGLGLALAHDIVNRHDGELTVKSKLGEGTTFTIILPVFSKT